MAWPTPTDITNRLSAYGVTVPAGVDLDAEIAEAKAWFESETGWAPFEADGSLADHTVDWESTPVIPLPFPMCDVQTVSLDGSALVADEDYWMEPTGALTRSYPYTGIRLSTSAYRRMLSYANIDPKAITINGKRGYSPTIPALAAAAVRDRVCAQVIGYTQGKAGQATEIKVGMTTVKYGNSQQDAGAYGSLMSSATKKAAGFKRLA